MPEIHKNKNTTYVVRSIIGVCNNSKLRSNKELNRVRLAI